MGVTERLCYPAFCNANVQPFPNFFFVYNDNVFAQFENPL